MVLNTIATRRSIEWENFLVSIIQKREENGELPKLKKTQLERLILKHLLIPKLKKDIILLEITQRERKWIK